MANTMKAIRVHVPGGVANMKYEDIDVPSLKEGEVLVKNSAIGVNFIDTYHRTGLYKLPLPAILGREGGGVVEKVGAGVKDFAVGDQVAYVHGNSYAEYVSVPTKNAFKLPEGVSPKEGGTVLLQGLTAHALTRSTFPVKSGHTVLIQAGAGGLGQMLIQMCKLHGATVITTVSTAEKAEIVKSLHADHVINYVEKPDVAAQVKALTNNVGVDVVYDGVGLTTYLGSIASLKPLGLLVLCGNASGSVPPIDPQALSAGGSLFMTRPTLMNYIAKEGELHQRCVEIFGWLKDKKIHVNAPKELPLSQAAQAHELLEGRKTTGKLLLIP